jgi:hypothetical protein
MPFGEVACGWREDGGYEEACGWYHYDECLPYCNGVDDDYDGLVDEGGPDRDGDGVVECPEE